MRGVRMVLVGIFSLFAAVHALPILLAADWERWNLVGPFALLTIFFIALAVLVAGQDS